LGGGRTLSTRVCRSESMELQREWTAATELEKRDWDGEGAESGGGGPIVALVSGCYSFQASHSFR
jgi:hypothetical protein